MRSRIVYTLFFLLVSFGGVAKDLKYPVAAIPKELKKDADAVVREYRCHLTIKNEKTASYTVHEAITILNKKGLDQAHLVLFYDPDRSIKQLKGTLYNSFGMPVRKIKKSEVHDESAVNGFSFFEDNRVKYVEITPTSYPFTVEYDYEVSLSGFFYLPRWSPAFFNVAVQKSEYVATVSKDYSLRYLEKNLERKGQKKDLGDEWEFSWSVENLKAIEKEPLSPYPHEYLPGLEVAPSHFYYDHVRGCMTTWEEYGKWVQSLLVGRDELPEEAVKDVKKVIASLSTKREKVEALYKYMQKRTRYVSIQLGIGGYQPFPAEMVHEKGYGDCKALSNYMRSLLKVAGIPSLYVKIGASSHPGIVYSDFPTPSISNHIIVAVPNEKDTIWLECTSHTAPCGYLSPSCCGKRVLAVDEEKTQLIVTPKALTSNNTLGQRAEVYLDGFGNAKVTVEATYGGSQLRFPLYIMNQPEKEQKEAKYEELKLPGAKIEKINYTLEEQGPIVREELALNVESYASSSRSRMFMPLNVLNRGYRPPKKVANRRTDVFRRIGYTDCDTVVFHVPETFKVEAAPKEVNLEAPFGSFSMKVEIRDGLIYYYRRMQVKEGRFPPESYQEMIDFFSKISSADSNRLVLVKKS